MYLGPKWVGEAALGQLMRGQFAHTVREVHMHALEVHDPARPVAGAGVPGHVADVWDDDGRHMSPYHWLVMLVPAQVNTDHLEQRSINGLQGVGSNFPDMHTMRHKLERFDPAQPPLHHRQLRRTSLLVDLCEHAHNWIESGEPGAKAAAQALCGTTGMSLKGLPFKGWPVDFLTHGERAHAMDLGNATRGNDLWRMQLQRQ